MLSRLLLEMASDRFLTLQDLSLRLGISRKQIQALIKSNTGKSYREVRTICRMCRSIALLEAGCSVKKAALTCGYEYSRNYTRAIKTHLGISPSEIRTVRHECASREGDMCEEGGGV